MSVWRFWSSSGWILTLLHRISSAQLVSFLMEKRLCPELHTDSLYWWCWTWSCCEMDPRDLPDFRSVMSSFTVVSVSVSGPVMMISWDQSEDATQNMWFTASYNHLNWWISSLFVCLWPHVQSTCTQGCRSDQVSKTTVHTLADITGFHSDAGMKLTLSTRTETS